MIDEGAARDKTANSRQISAFCIDIAFQAAIFFAYKSEKDGLTTGVSNTKLYPMSTDSSRKRAASSLTNEAYDGIRNMLLYGDLPPGSRVSTLDLAKRLGISRTPVREALRRLSTEGAIRQVDGVGAFVQMPTRDELVDLYTMRELLESFAAQEAAHHIQDDEIEALEADCRQWRELTEQIGKLSGAGILARLYNRWISIDEHFHRVLVAAARNKLLSKTINDMRLMSRTLDLRRLDTTPAITYRSATWTYRHHASLVRALRKHDAERARHWMVHQIREGKKQHLARFASIQQSMCDSTRQEWLDDSDSTVP